MTKQPAMHKARLATAPTATRVRWWKALIDPSYNARSGVSVFDSTRVGKFRRTEVTGEHWCIIEGEKLLRRYFQPGTWEQGSIAVLFDPEETALSEYDWIVHTGMGQVGNGQDAPLSPSVIDTRTFTQIQVVVRGETSKDLSGTVSIVGDVVTGIGTSFTTDFSPAQILTLADDRQFVVLSVQNDVSLTLTAPVTPGVSGMAYGKGLDSLLYGPLAKIDDVLSVNASFQVGIDCRIDSTQENIEWLSPLTCPLPGERYSVRYSYLPRYVISTLGEKGPVVNGHPSLTLAMANLWKPEHHDS